MRFLSLIVKKSYSFYSISLGNLISPYTKALIYLMEKKPYGARHVDLVGALQSSHLTTSTNFKTHERGHRRLLSPNKVVKKAVGWKSLSKTSRSPVSLSPTQAELQNPVLLTFQVLGLLSVIYYIARGNWYNMFITQVCFQNLNDLYETSKSYENTLK